MLALQKQMDADDDSGHFCATKSAKDISMQHNLRLSESAQAKIGTGGNRQRPKPRKPKSAQAEIGSRRNRLRPKSEQAEIGAGRNLHRPEIGKDQNRRREKNSYAKLIVLRLMITRYIGN